jgi:alkanesulfonate monooxygenase SsuD/methylene tetrahydromethanopterin reductase-like flavin-dependent oxidoreductase (luciferase family)
VPPTPEVGIYLPQVAMEYPTMLGKARDCERLGFSCLWLYDHLFTPRLPNQPAFEGWTLATALLAHTTTLHVGHMVLCANFRPPALLGRMVSTLQVISEGRFRLGLGTGSYADEHALAGLSWGTPDERAARLRDSLEVLTRMATPGRTTYSGATVRVRDLPNLPLPAVAPPVHLGGIGPRVTLPLVARYADVWNVPTYGLARRHEAAEIVSRLCEEEGRDPATLRRSLQLVVAVAATDPELTRARAIAERRYGDPSFGLYAGGVVGTPEQVVERLRGYVAEGWTEFALILHDRAAPETLELLSAEVLPHL